MKKVYLLLTAICLTALTGCVKEEPYTLEEATIEVNLDTRSGTVSEQQGDRIEDVMIWVFKGENWGTLAGWRTYTPPTDAYAHTSLTLHIPVALCNGDSETYRLVAVLNKNHWGKNLNLSSETTYAELTSMKFANPKLIEQAIVENTPGTPATMPVSHWCDVTVTKAHTHANNNCAQATLNVFRSVAKTQLFVTKKSNDFSLEITGVTVNAANKPTEGMLLSSLEASVLGAENTNPTPAWFSGSPAKDTTNALSQSLKKADGNPAAVTVEANATTFTNVFVGSAFLYENADDGRVDDYANYDYKTNPASVTGYNNHYYMQIDYKIDGKEQPTGYVPLPAAVRNHDYQVRALVDAGGKLNLNLTVNDWTDASEKISYEDIVTVPENGKLKWTKSPDDTTTDGVINMGSGFAAQANCSFKLETPKGGQWHAELVTVKGSDTAFTFVDGEGNSLGKTTSGTIGTEGLLRIKTTKDNSAVAGGTEVNQAELRITASVTVGGVVRTYKVTGLTGLTNDANYIFEQGI